LQENRSKHFKLASEIKRLRSAFGLLPKKLPIQIVRWGEIAWRRLGSHEAFLIVALD
jgi:hypothetical protein